MLLQYLYICSVPDSQYYCADCRLDQVSSGPVRKMLAASCPNGWARHALFFPGKPFHPHHLGEILAVHEQVGEYPTIHIVAVRNDGDGAFL